jgi:aminoglycoside phosphotransferase (APT) family kinase protein
MVTTDSPPELLAILDWEMATIGDPLADLGYLTITWSQAGAEPHPMLRSPVTAAPGWPTRDDLVQRYAERTGRDVSRLPWYQALALWKSAVFCEAIYGRYLRGEHEDPWAACLDVGVPRLIEVAASCLDQA